MVSNSGKVSSPHGHKSTFALNLDTVSFGKAVQDILREKPNRKTTHIELASFSVEFERVGKVTVKDFTIYCLNTSQKPVGQVSFGRTRTKLAETVLSTLAGVNDEYYGALPDKKDPLPSIQLLRNALENVEETKTTIRSNFGKTGAEIAANYGDAISEDLTIRQFQKLITVSELAQGVFHVHLPSEYLLSSIFVRFQEYYESPRLRGKIFSLDEFKRYYRGNRPKTGFSYYEDWGGFNIPDTVLTPFFQGKFDPLLRKEKALMYLFRSEQDPFYIIGTWGKDNKETLRHELAHGLYHTNEEYRNEVLAALCAFDTSAVLEYVKSEHYHQHSWADEVHAYIVDSLPHLKDNGVDVEPLRNLHRRLRRILKKYGGNVV